jgi:hypothetical protein
VWSLPYSWRVIFAIDDLDEIPNDFTILDVTFYKITESNFGDLPFCGDVTESRLAKMKEEVRQRFLNMICASTIVEADKGDEAIQKGKEEIEIALNLLRTFKAGYELRSPLNGIAKNLINGTATATFEAAWHRDEPSPWKYSLSKDDLTKMLKEENVIKPLILNPSQMGNRILRALRWTGMSTQETDQADKIIKYITTLECLFIKERINKAKLLAKRVAIIWTDNYGSRDQEYKDFYRLYNLRNDIVHGGSYTITDGDKWTMDSVARELVFVVANVVSVNHFYMIDDLLIWLNSKQGTWTPPPV